MELDIKNLTNDELYTKLNELYGRLRWLKHGPTATNHSKTILQCESWCAEIELEIQERTESENLPEAGTVAIIGEETKEDES